MEKERKVAFEILDEFVEFFERKGIKIPFDDRDIDEQELTDASLCGSDYWDLEDSIIEILKQNFRNNASKASDQAEEGFFPITSVHRDDIKEALRLTDEQAARITDHMMREIAHKMADDYCEQLFWEHLPIIAEFVAEREGISLSKKPCKEPPSDGLKECSSAPCLLKNTEPGGE